MSENIRVYHDEESGKLVGRDADGNTVPIEYEAISTGEGQIGSLESQNAIHPEFTQDFGVGHSPREYSFAPVNPCFSFKEALIDASSVIENGDLEGVAYGDGAIYTGEDTKSNGPATIHKWDLDGTHLDSYQLPSGSPEHTNSMMIYDGLLWIGGGGNKTDKTVGIDFGAKSVEETIDHAGAVDGENWRDLIPATDGTVYMLHTDMSSPGTGNAHLVDWEAARADKTTQGNVYQTLYNGGFISRLQSAVVKNRHLYGTTHTISFKLKLPFADQMGPDYPVTDGEGIVWVRPRGVNDVHEALEDIAYNPEKNEWYVGDNQSRVFRVVEEMGMEVPTGWDVWGYADAGPASPRVWQPDASLNSDPQIVEVVDVAEGGRPGTAEVWMHDDTATSGKQTNVIAGEVDGGEQKITIGIQTPQSFGGTNYGIYDGSWQDTGVARPSNPQWIKVKWVATGSETSVYISKDRGQTWEHAGTRSHMQNISMVGIRPVAGKFKVGTWSFKFDSL